MLLRTLALLLLAGHPASAAEPAVKLPACFYAFDYAPGHESVFCRTGPEAMEKIELSKANIVGPVTTLVTDGALHLHATPVTAADGSTSSPLLATARVPAGLKAALVVLFPNPPASPERYRCLVFENDRQSFPLGTYRVINLAPHPIRGAVGRKVIEAKPGGVTLLELEGDPGSIVPVRFEYQDGSTWNLLTETRCAIRKDRRWLLCIYQDPRSGRLNLRSIPDRTRPVAAAPN